MSVIIISSLPTTINSPGQYKLDVSGYFSTTPITINANDVTLDLGDNYLVRYTSTNNTDKGVYIAPNLTNITIRNGTIRGFFYGIHYDDQTQSRTCTIDNVKIQECTFRGIVCSGRMNIVKNCIIYGIRGTTVYQNPFAMGIECTGQSVVINNKIYEVYGAGTGEGVHISSTDHGYNTVIQCNDCINKDYSMHTWPIWVGGDSNAWVMDNLIINAGQGIAFSSPTAGGYRNNTIINCTSPYVINSTNVSDLS